MISLNMREATSSKDLTKLHAMSASTKFSI